MRRSGTQSSLWLAVQQPPYLQFFSWKILGTQRAIRSLIRSLDLGLTAGPRLTGERGSREEGPRRRASVGPGRHLSVQGGASSPRKRKVCGEESAWAGGEMRKEGLAQRWGEASRFCAPDTVLNFTSSATSASACPRGPSVLQEGSRVPGNAYQQVLA